MPDLSMPILIFLAIVVLYVLNCIKILREYERGVIFTLGRVSTQPYGPGIIFVFRPIQQMVRISLRQDVLEVPAQDVITRDNVTIKVNAVVTLYVVNPNDAAIKVANYVYQTSQLAQTTLRTVLGEVELDELLSHRDKLNVRIQSIMDQRTEPFGVKVVSVEVKQVDLPDQMQRAMAKQAEAEREKRAKVIHAGGEYDAAQKLGIDSAVLREELHQVLAARNEHPETWPDTLTAVGSVSAAQGVMVSPEIGGTVSEIDFESGATVQPGDLLVRLDTSSEEAQLRAADAQADLARVTEGRVNSRGGPYEASLFSFRLFTVFGARTATLPD